LRDRRWIHQDVKFGADRAEAAGFEVHHIDQADEVNAVLVEAVPAVSVATPAVAVEEILAILIQHVVLAGDKENVFGAGAL
jgi:hypothetical protein